METRESTHYPIRKATSADIAELIRMQRALQENTDAVRDNLLRPNPTGAGRLYAYYLDRIGDELTQLLIAHKAESKRAVGMGTGKIWVHADCLPSQSGELIDLWVDPEHRGRGVGRRIIEQLLQFFRAHEIQFLAVNYVNGNLAAESLWRKLGFEPALVTATADRLDVQRTLSVPSKRILSIAGRSWSAERSKAYEPITRSG